MQLLDKAAFAIIGVASFLSAVGHWHLGCVAPFSSVGYLLKALSSTHGYMRFSAEDVLQRGLNFWDGSSAAAAAHHEALGRAYAHSGLETKALIEFRHAGNYSNETQVGIRAKLAAAVETARIQLRNGLLNEALDAVSETISASAIGVSDIRSHALHILVQSVLKSKPSDTEAAGVSMLLRDCLTMLAKNGADGNTQALLHEDSASLAELRGAWQETQVELAKALELREKQRSQVKALRAEHWTCADDTDDIHFTKLHLRLAERYFEKGRLQKAALHSTQAEHAIWAHRRREPEERLGLASRALLLTAKIALQRGHLAEAARAADEAAVVAGIADDGSLPWKTEVFNAVDSIRGSLATKSQQKRPTGPTRQPVQRSLLDRQLP